MAARGSTKRKKKRTEQNELSFCKKNVKSSVVDPDPDVYGIPESVIICKDPDLDRDPSTNKQKK